MDSLLYAPFIMDIHICFPLEEDCHLLPLAPISLLCIISIFSFHIPISLKMEQIQPEGRQQICKTLSTIMGIRKTSIKFSGLGFFLGWQEEIRGWVAFCCPCDSQHQVLAEVAQNSLSNSSSKSPPSTKHSINNIGLLHSWQAVTILNIIPVTFGISANGVLIRNF